MIITCENCSKTFNINEKLIPTIGRLLQCGSCNHKWFFKPIELEINNEKLPLSKQFENNSDLIIDETIEKKDFQNIKQETKKKIDKKKKNPKIIKNSIVFIISIIALILFIDTFKYQLNNYIPGINSILNNLYESLKDLSLFFNDLIN